MWLNLPRLMPGFIVIGAQRCGTSSVYHYLIQHPCVLRASVKEIHYFDIDFCKGTAWYRTHFPSVRRKYLTKLSCRRNVVTGEATPYYIFHPWAPERAWKTVPRSKLIVMLRNPVDRAYSHYHLEVKLGNETLSFEDAIEREEERLNGEKNKILRDKSYYSFNYQHYSYISRGAYVDQLKAWSEFFPNEQMLIIKSEDFYSDPPGTMKYIFDFLGLPNRQLRSYRKYYAINYPNMDANTRKRLISYFEPYNRRLYGYLRVNFGWDK